MSEVSADRAGLISCPSFAVCYSALRKIASGTSSPLIRCHYSSDDFQTNRLKRFLEDKDYLLEAKRSHPYSLLRIGALRAFENSIANATSAEEVYERLLSAEKESNKILGIMSPKKSNDASWLQVLAAFWVAYADGSFDMSERKEVAKLCSDKEFSELFNLCRSQNKPCEFMEELFLNTYQSVKLSLPKKAHFIEKLAAVALADGSVSHQEESTIKYICELINLDVRFLPNLLKDVKH